MLDQDKPPTLLSGKSAQFGPLLPPNQPVRLSPKVTQAERECLVTAARHTMAWRDGERRGIIWRESRTGLSFYPSSKAAKPCFKGDVMIRSPFPPYPKGPVVWVAKVSSPKMDPGPRANSLSSRAPKGLTCPFPAKIGAIHNQKSNVSTLQDGFPIFFPRISTPLSQVHPSRTFELKSRKIAPNYLSKNILRHFNAKLTKGHLTL